MRRGFDYSGVFHYIQKTLEHSAWTDLDTAVNIFFVIVLLAGVVFFILTQLMNIELRGSFSRFLFYLYFMIGISYLFWITDLVFGLPFGWSRFRLVPILMGTGFVSFSLAGSVAYWRETKIPIARGFRKCPGCKSIILELSLQCPQCGKKL